MDNPLAGAESRTGFFDRRHEQKHFEELVGEGPARVMTIKDGSGRGKSQLLKRLRDRCKYANPPLPVALVPIHELTDKTPFQLAKRIDKELGKRITLAGFKELRDARLRRDPAPFAGRTELGMADARGAIIRDGGVAAGIYVNTENAAFAPPEWSDELDEVALDECVAAFVEDLVALPDGAPVVLLIDTYEACNEVLNDWLLEFVNRCLFTDPPEAPRLVMVFAGQTVPTPHFELMLGDRWPEVGRPVNSLSVWEREDVQKFLEFNGVEPTKADVDFLEARLTQGMTIERALRFVREYLVEESLDEDGNGQ